ncbi:hypothetical protein SAMN05414139_10435 [Burkholderia sp. D7]|nr:hypothetical protein SAMN05414139_10435 [Burkholderia sp. D7]
MPTLAPHTAWDIEKSHLSPLACAEARLRFALNYAVLAPSSHNSQPWRFIVDGDTVMLCADRTRALSVVDPFDRELVISCGAALFNLRVALSHFGLGYAITLLPSDAEPDVLAKVRVLATAGIDASITSLFHAIARRVTTREAFRTEAVAPEIQQRLLGAAEAEGVQAVCIDDLRRREEIAQLIAEADRIQFHDPRFRRELASWIHPRRTDDGMPAYGPGINTLLDIAVPLVGSAIRTFDLGGGIAAAHESLVQASPILFCIGTGIDDPQSWLAAGQALERVLLTGVESGLTASYLNQPVETEQLRDSLRQITGIHAQPQLLLRMGRGPHAAHSLRRSIQDVVS